MPACWRHNENAAMVTRLGRCVFLRTMCGISIRCSCFRKAAVPTPGSGSVALCFTCAHPCLDGSICRNLQGCLEQKGNE